MKWKKYRSKERIRQKGEEMEEMEYEEKNEGNRRVEAEKEKGNGGRRVGEG
jgi:hypothetical protein